MKWFECKVRYDKTMDNGVEKRITETYLLSANNFSDAESRIIGEMKPFVSGAMEVAAIKVVPYNDVFSSNEDDDEKWYKCKITMQIIDENSGKEKKANIYYLTCSDTSDNAIKRIKEEMKDCVINYEISAVIETPILLVFKLY